MRIIYQIIEFILLLFTLTYFIIIFINYIQRYIIPTLKCVIYNNYSNIYISTLIIFFLEYTHKKSLQC